MGFISSLKSCKACLACETSEEVLTLCRESIAFMKKLMLMNPKKTNITPESQPRLQKSWDLVRPPSPGWDKIPNTFVYAPLSQHFLFLPRNTKEK